MPNFKFFFISNVSAHLQLLVLYLSWTSSHRHPGSLQHTPAMDGGSADIAGSKYLPAHPCASSHRHPWLLATYRPSMDITTPPSWLLAQYRPSLDITTPPSLAPCGIQHIPVHKKATKIRCFILQNNDAALNRNIYSHEEFFWISSGAYSMYFWQ